MIVYCVICIDPEGEHVHIFSTPARRAAFMAADPRTHVAYDYVVDEPGAYEGVRRQ